MRRASQRSSYPSRVHLQRRRHVTEIPATRLARLAIAIEKKRTEPHDRTISFWEPEHSFGARPRGSRAQSSGVYSAHPRLPRLHRATETKGNQARPAPLPPEHAWKVPSAGTNCRRAKCHAAWLEALGLAAMCDMRESCMSVVLGGRCQLHVTQRFFLVPRRLLRNCLRFRECPCSGMRR